MEQSKKVIDFLDIDEDEQAWHLNSLDNSTDVLRLKPTIQQTQLNFFLDVIMRKDFLIRKLRH